MTTLEQAARQALETLERASDAGYSVECDETITALREALEQAAPKAAPGEREQAAQRLRELGGISPDDVTDPLHPRYIEGYKAGHAAGRKRAAPQPAPAPLSEREAFEAWIEKDGGDLGTFGTPPNMHYRNSSVNNAWVAWKARAALAAQGGKDA